MKTKVESGQNYLTVSFSYKFTCFYEKRSIECVNVYLIKFQLFLDNLWKSLQNFVANVENSLSTGMTLILNSKRMMIFH